MPYTIDGQKVRVMGTDKVTGKYIVAICYQGPDGEEWEDTDSPIVVDKVFDTLPVTVFDAEITELKEKKKRIVDSIRMLNADLLQAKSEYDDKMAKFKKVVELKYLEDFIDGKLTHLARPADHWRGPAIFQIDDAKSEHDGRDLKLLTLFGASNGDLQWRLNRYNDGSGGLGDEIYPFTSEEAARKFVQKSILDLPIKKFNHRILQFADENGMHIRDGCREMLNADLRKKIVKKIDKARATERKFRSELRKVEND